MAKKILGITPSENSILEDVSFDAFYIDESLSDSYDTRGLVVEAKTTQIGSTHNWYRIDPPNGEPRPGNLKHMHGYIEKRGNLIQIFAVCVDGSGHDGCHQTRIPQEFVPILKSKGFELPKDNLIEMLVVPQNQTTSYKNSILNKTLDYNIQIGDIYVMRLFIDAPFPYACVKVVDIERDEDRMPINIIYDIDIAGTVSRGTLSYVYFRLICCPFKLHHIILEKLGFVYDGHFYSKVINLELGEILCLRSTERGYEIEKEMSNIEGSEAILIQSLDELQSKYKQLYNKSLRVIFTGFSHNLILISQVDVYIQRLVSYIQRYRYCFASFVPNLFTIGYGIPMGNKDCDSIISFAKACGIIKDDIHSMEYHVYVLCDNDPVI